ncbi:hypothetical protein A2715_03800 [Candidatus Woesebacteria bacterium RIFCSPHIGHO2_01_FULL_39_32]|uniref:RNase H type-1 domain-containing protein n=1 Tax=Candidatus Woesebacteria bacterium RIFCSPLOWO2_01_FULL_39_25 TaxID=1802521 RepID=A0A1F8BIR2_9BACT|nr:MAG: hypothetical protein A2124_01475 [Candidatus Woesebacteria bacterium GWB1_37_5]OGM25039.1 MAG: hypothetical protein A2715_03800 [Candidatus Woesebacteria bacterium RIFCSPHIGHO2_01_FULL_39_32]OGM36627.1 MAG: hypothetical protein A3F01_05720 [Candidatus Woesebacteria bacterium RIFCSPHIGHO2_12_FULL_38_11]OGM63954.1 MAG: hypothetical protein A2893_00390 [Candidatus Woesebacteria bacterium RIFCSPLOWO2_01_FULL_39_25]
MNNSVKIYTDGGARGNPGPAAAAFVVVADGKVIYKDSKFLGISTNNEAEYRALIIALEWLKNNKEKLKEKNVLFLLDSQLVVRQLTKLYKVKSENLKPLVKRVENLTSTLSEVELVYLSVGREENRLADKLVNLKLDENLV